MSYWSLSDVFEEQGVVQRPFYGGYGLIAAGGIPKAAYNAFALLHDLGTQRIPLDSENAIATRRPDGSIALAIWNYAEPGEQPAAREFDLKIAGARSLRIRQVDRDSGSALTKWEQMGKPDFPTREQQAQLRAAAQLPAARPLRGTKVTLAPQALALIEITLK
jgi:xylan 1,4-beta-xylosidase